MTSFSDFISWEAQSRDTIDFKKIYVDMADGDIVAGLTLSEIVFWYLPGGDGKNKLRVQHEGQMWIAAPRAEWWDRCRMTPRQSDRALKILKQQGLIITKRYKWHNVPTVHIRIVEDRFVELWNQFIKTPISNPILPNGEMDFTNPLNLVTEITTETTKELDSAPSAAVGDVVQKPRNPTFDLIVKFGYRIALEDKAGVASVAKSAGWLASWCDGNAVKAGPRKSDGMIPGANPPLQGQELFDMLAEYHKKGIDFPNTIKPFVRYASEHRAQQRAKARPQYEFTPPEERQREIQRLLLGEAIS